MQRPTATPDYDVARMQDDLKAKGWLPIDLARKAKVSHMAVSRFFSGQRQTPRMAKRLSRALGHPADFYLIRTTEAVAS